MEHEDQVTVTIEKIEKIDCVKFAFVKFDQIGQTWFAISPVDAEPFPFPFGWTTLEKLDDDFFDYFSFVGDELVTRPYGDTGATSYAVFKLKEGVTIDELLPHE